MRHKSVSTLTLDQAYQAAYLWMFHVGEPPTEIAERGAQSVELRSERIAAFVRIPDRPLNQRTILAVLASEPDDRSRLIFSTAGFSLGAISIAEAQSIALFELDGEGSAIPMNGQASQLAPLEPMEPPFKRSHIDDDTVRTKGNRARSEFPDNDWIDCPSCGTNQHISLDACRICGADLEGASATGGSQAHEAYRCLDCGSRNIETLTQSDKARLV
jgi:DNA-directed RNA polymerase subunit RPC12/RpoP